jgi:hypothetical protein
MTRWLPILLMLLLGLPTYGQALPDADLAREQLIEARAEAVRARGFIRATETQLTKTIEGIDRTLATLDPPQGTIAFYNIGGSGGDPDTGNTRRLDDGWDGLADAILRDLEGTRIDRVWLHNPYGNWIKTGGDRLMWIDQWLLLSDARPELADAEAFAAGVARLKAAGVREVVCYFGGPETLPIISYEAVEPLIRPALQAGCSIAFDHTMMWEAGDATDRLIQQIRRDGHRVYCEAYPFADRIYGRIDGWVMMDNFLGNQVARGFTEAGQLAALFPAGVERIIIQREWTAEQLQAERDKGETLAVRLWTEAGRELAQ